MQLPEGKSRLDMVREGLAEGGSKKRGRFVVSIAKLKEDARNERKTFRNMEGLISSIKAFGLIEPLTVTTETDDTYRIITGHRRFRAAQAAGLELVEVLIRDPEDERTRRQKSVISNVQREDVGPVEMAEALQAIMDEDERIKSQDDLAKVIGKDKAWVSGMLRILTLPPELQHKVGYTQLSLSYEAMIRIARVDDKAQQSMLVDMLLGGATQGEIRSQIDELKEKPAGKNGALVSAPKPKRVYRTKYQATVIVQSTTKRITQDQVIGALQEALGRATNPAAGGESAGD
jgi:ParB family chromosome partitioning protein